MESCAGQTSAAHLPCATPRLWPALFYCAVASIYRRQYALGRGVFPSIHEAPLRPQKTLDQRILCAVRWARTINQLWRRDGSVKSYSLAARRDRDRCRDRAGGIVGKVQKVVFAHAILTRSRAMKSFMLLLAIFFFGAVAELKAGREVVKKERLQADAMAGIRLSADEAKDLEDEVAQKPEDVSARAKLLGYYLMKRRNSVAAKEAYRGHVL